jgi:hypothetical protein
MKMFNKKKCLMTICLVGAITCTQAQNNFSGLLNAKLQKENRNSVVPILNNVVAGLFELVKKKEDRGEPNDENIAVNINQATVLNDSKLQLQLQVKYAANAASPFLIAEVVNKKGEPVKECTIDSIRTTNSGDATFNIFLKPDAAPAGATVDFFANYLRLKTYNPARKNYGENYFTLNKKFQSGQKIMQVILPANAAMTAISQSGTIDATRLKRVNVFAAKMYTLDQPVYNVQQDQQKTDGAMKQKMYHKNIEMIQPASTTVAQPSVMMSAKALYLNPDIFLLNTSSTGTTPPATTAKPELEVIDLTNDNNLNIETDEGFTDLPNQLTNIKLNFILKTSDKGEFFYIPNSFNLKWTPDNGYDFSMTYSAMSDASAGTGNVRIRGTLTPKINGDEVKLVEKFLKEYCRKKGITFISFRDFPAENYGNTLAESLQAAFDVNKNKISQTSSNSLKDEFVFSWVVDSKTKDDIQAALISGGGISADLSFSPSQSEKKYSIRVQIKLDDPQTFGHFELPASAWRNTNFRNPTAFPVKINAVHFLDIASNADKINIYSCPVNRPVILPGDEVNFESSAIPNIDNKISKVWIDYTIEKCEPCYQTAVQQLTGGVSAAAQEIKFQGIGCFKIDSTTANQITIEVRSKQFDPQGNDMVTMPTLKLTDTAAEKTVKPLYVPKSKDPEFEYRITFITEDGETKPSDWIKANNLNVIIGKKLVKDNCFKG